MKFIVTAVVSVFLLTGLAGHSLSREVASGTDSSPNAIMKLDWDALVQREKSRLKTPKAYVDKEINSRLSAAVSAGSPTSMSLLEYISYVPEEREQGSCGNCWVWASTGALEIAQGVQEGVPDRNSIQFFNSCHKDKYACDGGGPSEFAQWYGETGYSIPWSNTNGTYKDGSKKCAERSSSCVSCRVISKKPPIPITSITSETVPTQGVGQAAAIQNIKNVLNQNKGVVLGFHQPDTAGWDAFKRFWHDNPESTVWNPDDYCGKTIGTGSGGHDVLVVGYNDDDPVNGYWVILNSWGTAGGERPNGLFHMAMNMNYDCTIEKDGEATYSRTFSTQNVAFPACAYTVTPSRALAFGPGGGSSTVKIAATAPVCPAPAISTDASWLHASSESLTYSNGKGTLRIKADATNSYQEQSGKITIGSTDLNATLRGRPCALKALSLPHDSFDKNAHIGNTFTVTTSPADCTWTAQATSDWIIVTAGSGANGGQAVYNVEANTGKTRTGRIRVNLDQRAGSKIFTVIQQNQ